MPKAIILLFLVTLNIFAEVPQSSPPPRTIEPLPETKHEPFAAPGGSVNQSIGTLVQGLSRQLGSPVFTPTMKTLNNDSGDGGLKNLRLNSTMTLSSFDDSTDTVNSSGHFRDYSLTLTGDLTEKDTLSLTLSNNRYETGGTLGILARSIGATLSWHHSLSDNYGAGSFLVFNNVDIEETNGNTHSYAYGAFFTSFHAFESFDLSTVTTLAHTDYDIGHEILFVTAVTASKQLTDNFGSYLTLTFQDSIVADPDGDSTYGSWEIGGIYSFSEKLAATVGFSRTEFLNNFSDNTLILGLNWVF
jgi:hypothetical protein